MLKVEEPAGDPLRRRTAARTALPEDSDSALFQFLNARGLSLNVKGTP